MAGSFRIAWTAEAAAELNHMLAHIAEQDRQAARLVAGRILKVEKSIRAFPKAGRHDRETDTYDRYVPRTRIILTYSIRDSVIWIVSVWHTSRDPETKTIR